jgi:hypothetical protein
MTGLGLSEMKTVVDSELAVAHLVFKVADLKSSCRFYSNLGIPPFVIDENVAIIELRGGTHLLSLPSGYKSNKINWLLKSPKSFSEFDV